MKMRKYSVIAAVLAAALTFAGCSGAPGSASGKSGGDSALKTVAAVLPEINDRERDAKDNKKLADIQDDISGFYSSILPELMSEEENSVVSPLNIYMALSMLAEVTAGDTQAEILQLLRANNIEQVRERANTIFKGHFNNKDYYEERLANSVWLNNDISYVEETFNTLAETYHASSFSGVMGSPELDQALQGWINENTGDLLKNYSSDVRTDPEGVLELVSTIYLKAMWSVPFSKDQTTEEVFKGISGDENCMMMHQSEGGMYYRGEDFGAVIVSLYGADVLFVLPDEGKTPADIINDSDLQDFLEKGYKYENSRNAMINMSVPKFSVSSETDLCEALKAVGLTKVFAGGDFSPLTGDTDVFLSKASHAAILEADEEGITGAAYTDFALCGAGMPPEEQIDFVLDRPFLAVVRGMDGSMIFAASIYDVAE